MKEISKAEFIRRITGGKSIFIGISPVCTDSELGAVKKARLERHASHARTCKAKSNQELVFSNDSHLSLKNVSPHTTIKCYEDGDILIVENKWLDIDWQGNIDTTVFKYLYYTMLKEV